MDARPMTKEEANQAVTAMQGSADKHGWWAKVCIHCEHSVGGRLAEYGKPTPNDLKYAICPNCYDRIGGEDYDGNQHIRLEFVPGDDGEAK